MPAATRPARGGTSTATARAATCTNRDVDVHRSVKVDVDDHDDAVGAAIVGGVVGMGVGAAIANENQPTYQAYPPPQDY